MGANRGASIAGHAGLGPRTHAAAVALFACAAILALSACGSGETARIVTPSATSAPAATPTSTPVLGEPKTIVEIAVTACRRKDGELLASLVSGGVSDAEVAALFSRGSDVQLRSFTFPTDDDSIANVVVVLQIQRTSGAEEVERMWELEQQGDVWRFTSLPDCY